MSGRPATLFTPLPALFLALVSAALLLGALGFQYLGGLAPCEMCYWQRYAHGAVIVLALVALLMRRPRLTLLPIVAMFVSAGIALYHAGVEQRWWANAAGCSAGFTPGATTADLVARLRTTPLVLCDSIPWQFLGLSMAAWNALLSAGAALVAVWLFRSRRSKLRP